MPSRSAVASLVLLVVLAGCGDDAPVTPPPSAPPPPVDVPAPRAPALASTLPAELCFPDVRPERVLFERPCSDGTELHYRLVRAGSGWRFEETLPRAQREILWPFEARLVSELLERARNRLCVGARDAAPCADRAPPTGRCRGLARVTLLIGETPVDASGAPVVELCDVQRIVEKVRRGEHTLDPHQGEEPLGPVVQ